MGTKTTTLTPRLSYNKLISVIAGIEWEGLGYEGTPPIPTPDDLKPYEPVQIAHDRNGGLNLDTIRETPIRQVRQMFGVEGPIYQTPELNSADKAVQSEFENTGATTVGEIEERHPPLWEKYNVIFMAKQFFTFGVFLIEDISERIEATHRQWLDLRRVGVQIPHPLAPIVSAWLVGEKEKPVTREYERKHPGAVLPQKSVASVRYPLIEVAEASPTLLVETPSVAQLFLPTFERKMYLPEYLPIQLIKGVDITGRNGVLPYPIRFFFEVGMSLKPKARKGWYTKTLFDAAVDIGIVDPKSDSRKYLTTKTKQSIHNALTIMKEILIPYQPNPGGIGLWQPFYTQSIPTKGSDNNFPIRVRVQFSPDDKGGVLVEKQIVRDLYQYLTQLNVYLAACVLFNQYGRSPNNILIDPTEPDPNTPRLENGQYVHPSTGEPLFKAGGEPITDLFDSEAFEILKPYRVYRKEADNYPTLEKEEIMRAAYPNEPWIQQGHPGRWEKKAQDAWEAIAKKGYIRIEQKGNGLQILPSDGHVRLHHEILEASKRSQK